MSASPLPVVSSELIARLEQALVDAEGKQLGPQSIARIDGATVVRELPAYRRSALVHVWGRPSPSELANLLQALEPGARVDIVPGAFSPQIGTVLRDAGFEYAGIAPVLYGKPRALKTDAAAGVTLRRARRSELPRLGELFSDGWQTVEADRTGRVAFFVASASAPDRHIFVAEVDATPAAIAVLWIAQGIGYLAGAATLPRFRGRGCQTALIRRRLDVAARAGCELVCGATEFDTPSQHNMERAGMRIAYFKELWAPTSNGSR